MNTILIKLTCIYAVWHTLHYTRFNGFRNRQIWHIISCILVHLSSGSDIAQSKLVNAQFGLQSTRHTVSSSQAIFSWRSSQYIITRTWLRYVRVFTIAIPSVCLSSVCRLSSVTLVHPTQWVEPFGKISSPLCTLAILWPPCKILRR